jgi:hypothetical protein
MAILKPRRLAVGDMYIKMLLYGAPGVGKTTFAAQAGDHPALSPVLFLNFEGGLLSVVERGDVDAVDINRMSDLEEVYESLRTQDPAYREYRTIVIDSGSELYNQALVEATETGITRAARQGKNSDRTLDDTQLDDYGRASKQVFRIFRAFRDLPINLITTSTARFTYPRNADKTLVDPIDVGPSFSGNLATQMLGLFDFVHFMYLTDNEEGETIRCVLTEKAGVYNAKTRGFTFAQSLGAVVENPYLPSMYDLLLKTAGSDARPEIRPMHSTTLTEQAAEVEDEAEPAEAETTETPEDPPIPILSVTRKKKEEAAATT